MFCSNTRYKSQPNRNSDQFCYFEIAIISVSILGRKLTQITAVGMEKREICNPVDQDDARSWNEGLDHFSSGTEQFTQKWQQRSKYQGGNSWFGVCPLNDLVELPVLLKKKKGKKKKSWVRTPKDTCGFLPLKFKLDATSKLLSYPFFVALIYVFLSAKAFSFAYSQCGHQSKGWIQTKSQTRTQL